MAETHTLRVTLTLIVKAPSADELDDYCRAVERALDYGAVQAAIGTPRGCVLMSATADYDGGE